ncbi:TPA: hypothetical protein ACP32P_004930 [Pseudomonas aeruginosa]
MDTPIERAPLAPDLSQARYAVDLTGLVPAEVAAGLPPLPPNHFYFYPPDPLLEGDGAITAIEDSDPFDQYVYRLRRVLYQGRTRWQNVLIADTYNYDRVLMLDGAIQSAESDESLYHELLVQPAMLAHDEPRDVLIIGGGEGATLREVLSHASVRRAVMVDLDRELVELCREHLFQWHQGAFDDPRSELLTEDGRGDRGAGPGVLAQRRQAPRGPRPHPAQRLRPGSQLPRHGAVVPFLLGLPAGLRLARRKPLAGR